MIQNNNLEECIKIIESHSDYSSDKVLCDNIHTYISSGELINIASSLLSDFDGCIYEVYIKPKFNTKLIYDKSTSDIIGTDMLLVTAGGLISINFIQGYGELVAKEGSDIGWYIKYNSSRVNIDGMLKKCNDAFIRPMQEAIEKEIGTRESTIFKYIRNLIVFKGNDVKVSCVDDNKPEVRSSQVITYEELHNTLHDWFMYRGIIDSKTGNYNNRYKDSLNKVAPLLDLSWQRNVTFSYPSINTEQIKLSDSFNQFKKLYGFPFVSKDLEKDDFVWAEYTFAEHND